MALNMYNIKKWCRMLMGRSILHVNQGLGRSFSTTEIRGYYNDMTEKVTKEPDILHSQALPVMQTEKGETVVFPVAVFQYGLGAYDLFLQTGEECYLNKFLQCAQWAVEKMEKNGAWSNFYFMYPENPYGAMCQGEGVSLLVRAYVHTQQREYLEAAEKAVAFMMMPLEDGGTADYRGGNVILREYTHKEPVLNGWIFAWFGLYDYVTAVSDQGKYRSLMQRSCDSLVSMMELFDSGYWSMYDLAGRITSPFYHNLHIAQLEAMYQLTGREVFQQYAQRWSQYGTSPLKKGRAFIKKAIQKILEQ